MNYAIQIAFCLIAIFSAFIIWKKDSKGAKKGQKNRLKVLFALAIGGSIIGLIYGIQNEKQDQDNIGHLKKIDSLQSELNSYMIGSNSSPFIRLTAIPNSHNGIKYFIIHFDLFNTGKYPLHFVRMNIIDGFRYEMTKNGIQDKRVGVYGFMAGGTKSKEDANTFDPEIKSDIGTIAKGNMYPVYTATFSPEVFHSNEFWYPIEVRWNSGRLIANVNLVAISSDSIQIKSVSILQLNGKNVENYQKYIGLNKTGLLQFDN